ncbi:UbiA prenyltransferase family protein [Pedobacter sp. Leaf194]|uniref:UbiA prenyltransferase family protein n=1 Tax=Pedobacter sp. Leaf194 TaxID=1736297 RepID=UPI0009EC17EC|nr:UbiA prenyltransferase family protein [Pedobacter sp. Leaf194]
MIDKITFPQDPDAPEETTETELRRAGIKQYIAIARPDNWVKNLFMVPGMLFAFSIFHTPFNSVLITKIVLGVISICLIASANYVINEYLDAGFDKFHPLKRRRSSVVTMINPKIVYAEYAFLALIGIALSSFVSIKFLSVATFLLIMGVIYNVKPFRSKDRVFLDVLSESVNNPIRFAAGWFIFSPALGIPSSKWDLNWINTFPPVSIIIAYWMGGAFLMATKRFAEYRLIDNAKLAGLYRKSFRFYNENSLLVSMFFYAITCAFFMGIFLIKDRIELLVSFPFFALLFSWYLKIGLLDDSPVQGSEKLYTRKWFMLYLALFTALLCVLMFVDIPWLHWFLNNANNYNYDS